MFQVFEVMLDSVGVLSPKYNLEPPHYDGIQSLCLMGDLLFTGSRDRCIKKWDLAEQQQKHASLTFDVVMDSRSLVRALIPLRQLCDKVRRKFPTRSRTCRKVGVMESGL